MKKYKWMATFDIDSLEWDLYDTEEKAIEQMKMLIKDLGYNETQPFYIAKGTLATKADCGEFGAEWPYWQIEHGAEVLKIQHIKYGASDGITR